MRFKNKIVVVTGASSGIGEQTCLDFAKRGADIVLLARSTSRMEAISKKIRENYQTHTLVIQCDVSKKVQVLSMSKKVFDEFDHVDILVNNAGFAIFGSVKDLSIEEMEEQIKTNLFGAIYCTKAFLPQMLEQHSGHFVNVASIGASFSAPGVASYCATKYAMLGFSEGLKHELYDTGVDLTVVSPIMVRTPLFDHPSFENFSKFSTGISLSSETVAKAIIKASNSSRLEIVVPSVARAGIWFKQTFPYFINPIVGNSFRKQLRKRNN